MPRAIGCSPTTARRKLVLPTPFRPISAVTSPARAVERHVPQRLRGAVVEIDMIRDQHRLVGRRVAGGRAPRRGRSCAPPAPARRAAAAGRSRALAGRRHGEGLASPNRSSPRKRGPDREDRHPQEERLDLRGSECNATIAPPDVWQSEVPACAGTSGGEAFASSSRCGSAERFRSIVIARDRPRPRAGLPTHGRASLPRAPSLR